jgi:hypothetical protein
MSVAIAALTAPPIVAIGAFVHELGGRRYSKARPVAHSRAA